MQIEVILKNVLALLDQTLIPGSESLKMAAAKNDIKTAIKTAQEAHAKLEKQQEEIVALREEIEAREAELKLLQEKIEKIGGAEDDEN